MSVVEAKAALKACQDGIALITAQQKSNDALSKDYNTRLASWESRKNTHNANWENANRDRKNVQANWDNTFNFARNKRNTQNCDDQGCWAGWERVSIENCGFMGAGRQAVCRPTESLAKQDAGGNRPSDYNEPRFSEERPNPPSQNQTLINIACCANTLSIVGSQVDSSNISQQNSCLKDKLASVSAAEIAAKTTAKVNIQGLTNPFKNIDQKYIIMVIVGIIIFSSSSSGLLVILS